MSRVNDYSPSSSWTATRTRYRPGNPILPPGDGQFSLDHRPAFQNTRNGTPVTHYRPWEGGVLLRPPVATSSNPMDPYSRSTRIIIVNNNLDHRTNHNLTPFLDQFTHRPVSEGNMHLPPIERDESNLTKGEQETVLRNLHKQTYNHGPKMSRKVNLYYRDLNQVPNSNALSKNKDEDGKNCAVCLEDFEPGEEVMVTPCKHMFHEECILPWVKNHGKCPVCRSALCESIKENSLGLNTNRRAVLPAEHGLFSSDILSLIRAMDEAFVLGG